MEKEILFKNEFYPSGLTKEMVINYYSENKNNILSQLDNKPIAMFIWTGKDYIVKRNDNNKPIYLNETNYEKILYSRVISLGIEMEKNPKKIVIDIDPPKKYSLKNIKLCVSDILNSSLAKKEFFEDFKIISSSTSFHIWLMLNKKIDVDVLKHISIKELGMEFKDRYLIGKKRNLNDNKINIDFSSMKNRGVYLFPFSLCRNGLICKDVTLNWKTFKHMDARIS